MTYKECDRSPATAPSHHRGCLSGTARRPLSQVSELSCRCLALLPVLDVDIPTTAASIDGSAVDAALLLDALQTDVRADRVLATGARIETSGGDQRWPDGSGPSLGRRTSAPGAVLL